MVGRCRQSDEAAPPTDRMSLAPRGWHGHGRARLPTNNERCATIVHQGHANGDGISGSVEGHENFTLRLNRSYRRWQGANGASAVPAQTSGTLRNANGDDGDVVRGNLVLELQDIAKGAIHGRCC